jgi:hypothetical protein
MSSSSPPPRWRSLPSSLVVDALRDDDDIEDVVALTGAAAPDWLTQLRIPTDWQVLGLPESPEQAITRMAVFGPLGNGEWEAADTIGVTGFTGWPSFYDVYRNADRLLRGLGSSQIEVKALPVPPFQWTAAVRSSGTALLGDGSVWIQQSNYVAGSENPHASRLIVHTILVNAERQKELSQDISRLSADVYNGFIDALPARHIAR